MDPRQCVLQAIEHGLLSVRKDAASPHVYSEPSPGGTQY